ELRRHAIARRRSALRAPRALARRVARAVGARRRVRIGRVDRTGTRGRARIGPCAGEGPRRPIRNAGVARRSGVVGGRRTPRRRSAAHDEADPGARHGLPSGGHDPCAAHGEWARGDRPHTGAYTIRQPTVGACAYLESEAYLCGPSSVAAREKLIRFANEPPRQHTHAPLPLRFGRGPMEDDISMHAFVEQPRPVTAAGYTVERILGRGGMGVAYLARHPGSSAPVVI